MAAKQKSGNNKLAMTLLKGRTFIVLIVLLIFFSITADNFLSAGALLTVAKHVALYGILAIGMTYVIITGGIDLSVGSVAGLAGMIAGGLIQQGLTLKVRRDLIFQRSDDRPDHRSSGSADGHDQWHRYYKVQRSAVHCYLGHHVYLERIRQYSFQRRHILRTVRL